MKLIILFFALMLLPSWALDFGPKSMPQQNVLDEIGLVVNEEAISRKRLNELLEQQRARAPRDQPYSEEQLQEQIIMQILMAQMAKSAHLTVKDAEIDHAIATVAAQHKISVAQLYQQIARTMGLSQTEYRQQIAQLMLQDELKQRLIGRDINISEQQINNQITQIIRQRGTQFHLQDLLLPLPKKELPEQAYRQQMQTISQALKTTGNDLAKTAQLLPKAQFNDLGAVNLGQIPAKFAQAVATLNSGELVAEPVADADGLHFLKVVSKTAANGQHYEVEQGKLRHILIRRDPNNPQFSRLQIEQLYQQLQSGADFAQLAARYSQDPRSAVNGGDLGWMSTDQLDPRFVAVMHHIPFNTISEPFESALGWHIIEVFARQTVDRSEERIRDHIRRTLYEEALALAWEQKCAQMRQAAYIRWFP